LKETPEVFGRAELALSKAGVIEEAISWPLIIKLVFAIKLIAPSL
jgi:hypothetical protein